MKRIAIIKMGHVDTIVNFKKILKWKSDIFTISSLTEKKYYQTMVLKMDI